MHTKAFKIVAALIISGLIVTLASAFGADIKTRMKARLPTLNDLKAKGLIGENNAGLLEFRTGAKTNADVVQAENGDRLKVYRAIAQQQGSSPEKVAQRRALQIRGRAAPGTWLQDDGGQWYRK